MTDSTHRLQIVVLLVDDQPFVGAAIRRLLASEPDITCTAAWRDQSNRHGQ